MDLDICRLRARINAASPLLRRARRGGRAGSALRPAFGVPSCRFGCEIAAVWSRFSGLYL